MTPLRARNQTVVGAVTSVLVVLSALMAYNAQDLPIIGEGATYSAHFAESAGLEEGNEVQLAGVRVGEVTDVELDGTEVLATFRINGDARDSAARLGAESTASIEIKTLLGEKLLALTPHGDGRLDPSEPIPIERTTTPFEIQETFDQLDQTVTDLDTEQLSDSFDVISETFADTPEHLQETLEGLSSLSETVASRNDELARLLSNTSEISELISSRNEEIQKVIEDANLLFGELQQRKEAISALLSGTQEVSAELSGLVADNRAQLTPTLERLDEVTDILQANQDNLSRSLEMLGPFTRLGANALGQGRWFEGFFCGFLPPSFQTEFTTHNPQGCESPVSAPDQGVEVE